MSFYKCEICGQEFKTATGATSNRHLGSKRHKGALQVRFKPSLEHEILLFNAIQKLKTSTYSSILKFFTSFGIKTEITLMTIIKKLKDKDILYKGDIDTNYENVLQIILNFKDFNYPLTFTIKNALQRFQSLGFKYAPNLIKFFSSLSEKHPELLNFSSSKIGELPDLITFRQIFINSLIFYPNNNWDL